MAITSTEFVATKMQALELIKALTARLDEFTKKLRPLSEDNFYAINKRTGLPYPSAEAKEIVISAYRTIYYQDDQQPNESVFYIGAVAFPNSLRKTIETVNAAKDELDDFFISLAEKRVVDSDGFPVSLSKAVLEKTEFARLHKLQSVRHIPILDSTPEVLSFSMRKSPKVEKITKETAINMLLSNHQGTAEDNHALSALSGIPDGEVLAYRKPVPHKPMVNITFPDRVVAKNAVLPIAYPKGRVNTVLKANQSIKPGIHPAHRRKPSKLTPYPLVEHPEIYRYQASVKDHFSQTPQQSDDQKAETYK